jgi:hypothetical protein
MEITNHRQAIEQLLSNSLGSAVRLDPGETLNERTHVARFQVLEGPAQLPSSIIAKGWRSWDETGYDPESDDPRSPSMRLFGEWAGLQFLSNIMGKASPAPYFYAGDRQAGYFVIEDLGAGQNPAEALLGSDPLLAKTQLLDLAGTLGHLHAATVGHEAELEQIRSSLGPTKTHREAYARYLAGHWLATLDKLGIALQLGARDDLEQVLQVIKDPNPFLAYIHGDPCPDNWLNVNGQMRLFDFEYGGFRHALLDGVYGRIHFPTCWCVNRFPPEIPEAMEQAYRAELVKGCPAAADDHLFFSAVVECCAFWMLETCEGHKSLIELMDEDEKWGISTLRQRVLVRSSIFAELTACYGHLQALGETFADLAALLRSRWPQEAEQMPLYPAFR